MGIAASPAIRAMCAVLAAVTGRATVTPAPADNGRTDW
jgi:hypothetical protein